MAAGDGGIKPCVAAFGGDQFVLPQQVRELKRFFSIFYFTNNVGGVVAAFSSPILRQDVKCFGLSTCYPVAFGILLASCSSPLSYSFAGNQCIKYANLREISLQTL
ncbi:peptide transporter family 1 isoform X1 [Bemisia tabaci]|uniref:peptide transporter family 1 isoform X1 n=1 Tax=Bemisia tabaci TaxID=7038 RepID=UPI003B27C018